MCLSEEGVAVAGRRACKQLKVVAEDLPMIITASSTKSGETPPNTTLLPVIQTSTEAAPSFILYNVCVP